jgi:hypothetical protein
MKAKALFTVVLMTTWQAAEAEPVFMPQAVSVVQAKQTEVGVGAQFGYQNSEIIGSPGTSFKNRVWQIPVFARYGVTDSIETRLAVPIVKAVDSSEGLSSTRNADSGLGSLQIGAKWNFLKGIVPMAAVLDLDLPTANPSNNPGALGERYNNQLQQGFNGHLQLVADSPMFAKILSAHGEVGYMNTATYTTASKSRFNPSDLVTFGLSLDMSLKHWVEGLSASAEMVGNTCVTHSRTDAMINGNDMGTVLEVGPALRYQRGSWRTYAGFLADDGKAAFRAYNYRVNFGISMLFGGH